MSDYFFVKNATHGIHSNVARASMIGHSFYACCLNQTEISIIEILSEISSIIDISISESFNLQLFVMFKKDFFSKLLLQNYRGKSVSFLVFKHFHCQVYVLLPFERQQSRFSFCETEV